MQIKHYAKMIRKLLSAGISKRKIAKECGISEPTIQSILKGDIPTERIQQLIANGYDKIVSNFISLP